MSKDNINSNENLSEDDYLKKHLGNSDFKSSNSDSYESNLAPVDQNVNDIQFFNFSIDQLPCSRFYPKGTLLMVRAATVREIQAYSMVDDNNLYDVIEKMNNMLQSCVRVKYPNGNVSSYLDLKDQDRIFVVFLIRELTFQQGNELSVKEICKSDKSEVQIELKRENFIFHTIDEKLNKYYNYANNCFSFKVKNGKTFEIAPPNIGLQKSFTDYIVRETNDKKDPNLAFLKIIPFMLPGRNSITYEGIQEKLKEFENMDDISFQFLNSTISKITLGIKELRKKCACGEEVRTGMKFPYGASGIFVIHNAFEEYIEE